MLRGPTVILLALMIGFAACGGGGGKGGKTTQTPSAQSRTPVPTAANNPPPTVEGEATVTASGLQITDIQVGTGAEAKARETVTVNYTGWLADGTMFDSSSLHGGPTQFALVDVNVAGWREGVPGMKVGGKRRLIIPPNLAYGAEGITGVIPPNATLTFDIELVSVP